MQPDLISIRDRGRRPARHRSAGFTLTEILVVIGIIVLFIALAVPALSAISGTRSIAGAENNLSALLARAREEAIGIQEIRGVMFYIDPATDGAVGVIVRPAGAVAGTILLDTVPNRDYLAMPKGVRLRTVFDDSNTRYLGFNRLQNIAAPGKVGGVILFDSQGHVAVKPYGLWLGSGTVPSGMADLLGAPASGALTSLSPGNGPLNSQIGVAFFDKRTFLAARDLSGVPFSDSNAGPSDPPGTTASETEVDDWIDTHATPALVSRFTGSLVKGE